MPFLVKNLNKIKQIWRDYVHFWLLLENEKSLKNVQKFLSTQKMSRNPEVVQKSIPKNILALEKNWAKKSKISTPPRKKKSTFSVASKT